MMNETPVKNEDKAEKEDLLKESLDLHSAQNRNLLLFFLPAMIYVLITAASTTDRMILFPNSAIKLPLLGVEVDIFYFYLAAPLLVLILHYNILFNLLHHSSLLHEWSEGKKEEELKKVFPFIFNQVVFFTEKHLNYHLLRIVLWTAYFFVPFFILLFILWRFSDYQSLTISGWHIAVLMADASLLFLYWPRIHHPALFPREYDKLGAMVLFHWKEGYLAWPIYLFEKVTFWFKRGGKKRENMVSVLEVLPFWSLILLACIAYGLLLFALYGPAQFSHKNWLPRIELSGEYLMAVPPSDEILSAFAVKDKESKDAWLEYGKGLNLSNRSLRYADFSQSHLVKADISGADFEGAQLKNADLQLSDMGFSNFQGANLRKVNLSGADLHGANLEGADMKMSMITRANLESTNLSRVLMDWSVIRVTNMDGAVLTGVRIKGGEISGTSLRGADFSNANLQGAKIWNSPLDGANLEGAHLEGVDLRGSSLKGVFLEGAFLESTQMTKTSSGVGPGLFFVNLGASSKNWRKELILELEPLMEGRKYLLDTLESRIQKTIQLKPVSRPDLFWQERQKIACRSLGGARGMLRQDFQIGGLEKGQGLKEGNKNLENHMKSSCPRLWEKLREKA